MSHHRLETEELDELLTPEARAQRSVRWRRSFQSSLVTFVVVSAFFVAAWALSGAGSFWPGWVIATFGVVLFLRYTRYQRGPVSQEEVDEEVRRMESTGR